MSCFDAVQRRAMDAVPMTPFEGGGMFDASRLGDVSGDHMAKATKRTTKSTSKKTARKTATKAATKAAKKTARKRARKVSQRELLKTPTMTAFAKRGADGEFSEMDEVGRSLTADRRRRAKRAVPSGFGDQGDQPPRKRTAKKR